MKAPGVQTGRDTLSIPAPLGLRHHDGQPVTLEDAAHMVRVLTEGNTARSKALRSLEAHGRSSVTRTSTRPCPVRPAWTPCASGCGLG